MKKAGRMFTIRHDSIFFIHKKARSALGDRLHTTADVARCCGGRAPTDGAWASAAADALALPARRAFAWAAALWTASGVVYVTIAWPNIAATSESR